MSFREYEVKHKPLFASMKRAHQALSKPHATACSPDAFFDYLECRYGVECTYVEYVSFYDYVRMPEERQYNIAYIYTSPSLKIRDLLFADRDEITANTGWYPMISGARANFMRVKGVHSSYWEFLKHKPPYVHLGKPLAIKNVACDIASTALLLQCENGNILLDTGFEVDSTAIDQIDFIFISHFHRDHTGGLYTLLRQREIPVILSGITLEYLLNLKGIDPSDKERLARNSVLIERIRDAAYINNTIEFFDSYHCPGAFGLKYKYWRDCVIYPGDMCLTNGFFDYAEQFHKVIDHPGSNVSIITDCALVPRGDFAITDDDFDAITNTIRESDNNQIFISRGAEMLFSIYIRLFRMTIDEHKDWLFVVNDDLFDLLQNVLRCWLLPAYKSDPFIRHVIGNSRMNYAETRQLFPVSASEQFTGYTASRIMYLLAPEDLATVNDAAEYEQMDAYFVGPIAVAKNLQEVLSEYTFKRINLLSSPDWSFHSDRIAITKLLSTSVQKKQQFILFHAYPKYIKKYISELPREVQTRVRYISKDNVQL